MHPPHPPSPFFAGDSRWAENRTADSEFSVSSSVLLHRQLRVKERKHANLLAFLTEYDLWDALPAPARSLLCAHGELLQAAMAFRSLQNEAIGGSGTAVAQAPTSPLTASLYKAAIDDAVRARRFTPAQQRAFREAGMTPQDIYYAQVCASVRAACPCLCMSVVSVRKAPIMRTTSNIITLVAPPPCFLFLALTRSRVAMTC